MGSGVAVYWGWDFSTLGSDVSTLGFVTATPIKYTLGDCSVVFGLVTLRVGGVEGIRLLGIRCMQDLRRFLRSIIFGLGCGRNVVNWDVSAHRLKISQSYMIALNCAPQVIFSAYLRSQESVFIPYRILASCVSVGYVS